MANHNDHINLIWQIADLLRGPYRPPQYERVMLPMTVLRRFDCVLAPTKEAVLKEYQQLDSKYHGQDGVIDSRLNKISKQQFHNHSPLTFERLKGAPDSIAKDLVSYINGFSKNVRRIFEYFEFEKEIERMNEANILYLVVSRFSTVDLHPNAVSNTDMGKIFEHLIRKFNELANETAGDHFTPREVIRLMVNLLFINDDKLLTTPGTVRTMFDPACGTGGMLAEAQAYLREHHLEAKLYTYGQDYNKRAFATAASDMLIKEVAHNGLGENIKFGDSLIEDQFKENKFDYLLSNPPFGVDWKKQQSEITRENQKMGFAGRFGAGLPRVNDGALLFLQHMISKFEPVDEANRKYGSRLAIVFSGSPLFTGGAGSGESNIRRWIIENDWLEAVVSLPEQMFYNTGIGTYVWIVTNRKEKRRKGKIQLLDARDFFVPMRRSLGDKRREIAEEQIVDIVQLYGRFEETKHAKIFNNTDFGYTRVTVERPLRLRYQMTLEDKSRFLDACPHLLDDIQAIDKALGREPIMDWNKTDQRIRKILRLKWKATEHKLFRDVFTQRDPEAVPVLKSKNSYEPDSELRDFENIPLSEDVEKYFQREVLPHVPDAWIDRSKDKVGYEINFNSHFYVFLPPRKLELIDKELKEVEEEILKLLKEVTE
ncbi:type I restriction-modification system subunit M [Haliscomenobacter hydrossis]|uniref:site-specific DNA-methyltransferase (adenine-specific) n=1 Tax=Haliscomenobacter hydrossis (strain ATCC 27775 / DSM 1100 / LMG 10767 / O) TaxID=760192 RepID=F4KRW4_HALH1|nr:class I SAM-dependent DNA methyltransferase [Haliscomenobacter hydrossis]AEE50068.1 N-6 DNA methylase [Haliscomenobacter hydrossis DSM 1100]